jgi:hypothetical protein
MAQALGEFNITNQLITSKIDFKYYKLKLITCKLFIGKMFHRTIASLIIVVAPWTPL